MKAKLLRHGTFTKDPFTDKSPSKSSFQTFCQKAENFNVLNLFPLADFIQHMYKILVKDIRQE